MIRIIVFGGLYWGPLILRNYHLGGLGSCMGFEFQVLRLQGTKVQDLGCGV